MTVEEELGRLIDRFNRRVETTPAASEELSGLERTIRLRLTDEGSYTIDLRGGRLGGFRTSAAGPADITITTDLATFQGLVRKEIGSMKAIFAQKLKIDGSLDDKLLFRRLL